MRDLRRVWIAIIILGVLSGLKTCRLALIDRQYDTLKELVDARLDRIEARCRP